MDEQCLRSNAWQLLVVSEHVADHHDACQLPVDHADCRSNARLDNEAAWLAATLLQCLNAMDCRPATQRLAKHKEVGWSCLEHAQNPVSDSLHIAVACRLGGCLQAVKAIACIVVCHNVAAEVAGKLFVELHVLPNVLCVAVAVEQRLLCNVVCQALPLGHMAVREEQHRYLLAFDILPLHHVQPRCRTRVRCTGRKKHKG
mmetsp:Transcript_13998/g.55194  ORF Transcript_13998/g.55194 Transcript_13998/m.55194 type:complete len:201 (-) Transcript_13998:138-740(-)